jgi:4-hydroxymandelate oxidase
VSALEPPVEAARDLRELEALARASLPAPAWTHLTSGAGDELSLRANTERFGAIRLAPRCLVDVSRIDTAVTLLGASLPHPILLAPTGANRRYHPEAELATVRGAAAAEALSVQAAFGSLPIEQVGAAATSPMWFQTFVFRDREFTRDLAQRAVAAGARALVLTVDLPALEARGPARATTDPDWGNLRSLTTGPRARASDRAARDLVLDPGLTWAALDWLRSVASVPVVVKGVLRPDQAALATARGAAAVIVSNHGARNLDTVPATIDALPRVVRALEGRVPVLLDGGIRRGTDIAKALILGATAVLVGRPYLWGLASAGAAGVRHAIDLLRRELEATMCLLGAPTVADLTSDLLWTEG